MTNASVVFTSVKAAAAATATAAAAATTTYVRCGTRSVSGLRTEMFRSSPLASVRISFAMPPKAPDVGSHSAINLARARGGTQ